MPKLFDPSVGDLLAMIGSSALWFVVGRNVGIRVGYLKGRKAVREYYASKERVKV
jgi:hypothetical protein